MKAKPGGAQASPSAGREVALAGVSTLGSVQVVRVTEHFSEFGAGGGKKQKPICRKTWRSTVRTQRQFYTELLRMRVTPGPLSPSRPPPLGLPLSLPI